MLQPPRRISPLTLGAGFYFFAGLAIVGLLLGEALVESAPPRIRALCAAALFLSSVISGFLLGRRRSTPWYAAAYFWTILGATALVPLASAIVPLPPKSESLPQLLAGVLLHVAVLIAAPAALVGAVVAAFVSGRGRQTSSGGIPWSPPGGRARLLPLVPVAGGLIMAGALALIILGLAMSRSLLLDVALVLGVAPLWAAYRMCTHRAQLAFWRHHAVVAPPILTDVLPGEFDDVLVVDGRAPVVAHVMFSLSGRSTLVISERLVLALGRQALWALLLHEAAHSRLGHYRRSVVRGLSIGASTLVLNGGLALLLAAALPNQAMWLAYVIVGVVISLPRYLWRLLITRAFEMEADAFSAERAGGAALVEALTMIRSMSPPHAVEYPSAWTTHGNWAEREARLRAIP